MEKLLYIKNQYDETVRLKMELKLKRKQLETTLNSAHGILRCVYFAYKDALENMKTESGFCLKDSYHVKDIKDCLDKLALPYTIQTYTWGPRVYDTADGKPIYEFDITGWLISITWSKELL